MKMGEKTLHTLDLHKETSEVPQKKTSQASGSSQLQEDRGLYTQAAAI
jgi:hypothetical protein